VIKDDKNIYQYLKKRFEESGGMVQLYQRILYHSHHSEIFQRVIGDTKVYQLVLLRYKGVSTGFWRYKIQFFNSKQSITDYPYLNDSHNFNRICFKFF